MKLGWIFALLCTPAVAAGQDYVYVYGDGVNQNYQCSILLAYFDTTGASVFYADRCVPMSKDNGNWPAFPESSVYVSLDFAESLRGSPKRFVGDCQFVAHADSRNGSSSTVLDCRQ